MTFIAGPYTVTYGGNTLGITERGFELEYTSFAEPISGDNLGDSNVDTKWVSRMSISPKLI